MASFLVVCTSVGMAGWTPTARTDTNAATPAPTSMATAAARAPLTPVPMKTAPSPIDESGPASRGGWFVWERANLRRGTENYWAQHDGGQWIRINANGTFGRDGDVRHGRVLYSQERKHRYQSTQTDIWQYNLETGHRSRLPRAVNTRAYESLPSISGHYLLFQRQFRPASYATETDKVMLFDRRRQMLKTLAVVHRAPRDDFAPTVSAGQLNGCYATWSRVVWTERNLGGGWYYDAPHSRVVLYNVRTGTFTRHRLRPSTYVSTSAVSSTGTLYYVRYGVTASADESETPGYVMRRALGGRPGVVAKMPPRLDLRDLYVDDLPNGSHRLFFTVADSDGTLGKGDIYTLTDPPSRRGVPVELSTTRRLHIK